MESQNKQKKIVIFITVFIYLLGFGIVIPILPILSRDFGASPLQAGLLMSVYSLMQFLFAPFWGRLSDRFGRRPILIGCLLGEGLTYILFAYASNLELLFVARTLAGFFGASISTASAYISDITPPEKRSQGMALIGAAFGLGFVFGPAIGGGLSIWGQQISAEPNFHTKFTMLWVAAICFANLLFALKFLTESLSESNKARERKPRFGLMFEKLKLQTVGPLICIFFLTTFAMANMEASLVLYMKEKFNWGIKEVSFGFAYIGVMIVFTQGFLVRKLIPRFGERTVLGWGLGLFIVGLGGIALAPSVPWLGPVMTALAIGSGLSNPSIMGSISLLTPKDEQGSTLGVTQGMSSLGRIVGPAVGGFIFGALSPESPFIVGSLTAFVAFLVYQMIKSKIPVTGIIKNG